MAKNRVLSFILGLLVGVGGAFVLLPKSTTPTAPDSNACAPGSTTVNTDDTSQTCPVCPTCEEVEAKKALLPPPEFADDTKEFVANDDGEVTIRFKPVPGAARSRVTVVDGRNGRVRTYATRKNWVVVKDVPVPPDVKKVTYGVVLSSMNILGQEGDFGEKRKLTVIGRPELIAPTIKAITIED